MLKRAILLSFLLLAVFSGCINSGEIANDDKFLANLKNNKLDNEEDIRLEFLDFARENMFVYLPIFDQMEDLFTEEESSHPKYAFAIFYILQLHQEPLKEDIVESALKQIFCVEQGVEINHQMLHKLALYDEGEYRLWIEGARDKVREFYLLESIKSENGQHVLEWSNYYFGNTDIYEPSENDLWLADKSATLKLDTLETAREMIKTKEISQIDGNRYITTIRITGSDYGFKIIANKSID